VKGNAIVVAAIDGLATLESGVGNIVYWFFEELDKVMALVPALRGTNWTLHALSPRIDPASPDFSEHVHGTVSAVCAAHGGTFEWFPVVDDSSIRAIWALEHPSRWDGMCQALADAVRDLCAQHERVTVLLHGVMITALRSYLRDVENAQVILVAHSLGRIFTDNAADERISLEDRAFADMARFPQDRVGYIGPYFRDVLIERYGRSEKHLVPFLNGLPESSFRFPSELSPAERRAYLTRQGVPLDKRLVFAWGRCVWQKGHDALIPAFDEFRRRAGDEWHLVLLMPQEGAPRDYVATVEKLLARVPASSYTAIRRFDAVLPYHLLRDDAVEMIVFASRYEGSPLTMPEALRFGRNELAIVWHAIPPYIQFMDRDARSFPFESLETDAVADALTRACQPGTEPRSGVSASFSENAAAGLKVALEWWGTTS
jgi:glycosyltransferase involved in cell wall biosynthesis